jgi:hypothetical protein
MLAGARVRDTVAGRQRIAEELACLRQWCRREEVLWAPPSLEEDEPAEADHVG